MAIFLAVGVPLTALVGETPPTAGAASDRGVNPVSYFGNPQGGSNSTNVGYFNSSLFEYRIQSLDENSSGTHTSSDGFLKITINVTEDEDEGPSFDWKITSGSSVKALQGIFVKGGNGGNWYNYTNFTDVSGVIGANYDGYLHSPLGAGGGSKFYGLSHVSFGYAIDPDAYITIQANDTNKVGDPHTFTVTVWEDSTSNLTIGDFTRAAGENVTVSFQSLYGTDTIANVTGTTNSNGQFNVTINSTKAGQIKATAFSYVVVDNKTLFRTTDGSSTPNGGKNSGPATKTYVKAKISIEKDDTNAVTVTHTFTIKLQRDLGDGNGLVPFSGQNVTATLNGVGYFVSNTTQVTDVGGEAKVTINSNDTGSSAVSATFYGEIVPGNAATKVNVTTNGTSGNSGPAVKTYVNARITIREAGYNVVGTKHTYIILLERDLGDGNGYKPFVNQTVTATLSGVGYFEGNNTQTTDANGEAVVYTNSNDPGTSTVSASFAGEIVPGSAGTYVEISTDSNAGNSGPVVKTWYIGRITLTPATDTNAIGKPHEIVAKVEYSSDGTNWTIVPDGTLVIFSLSNNVPNAYFVGGLYYDSTVGGYASVFINADNPGTVTIGANSNFTVPGVIGIFSASTGIGFSGSEVSKTYVKARITIEANDTNAVTISHTFTITLERDLGDGKGYVPFGNQTVTSILAGVGYFVGPSTKTTDSSGKATVTINSNSTGIATVSASFEGEIVAGNAATNVSISTDGTSGNSGPAVKTYVNARISIKYDADNVVGNQHTFTILLERDLGDGNGYVPFSGRTVTATLTGTGFFVGSNSQTTDANGEATVVINSNDPGTSTVSASFAGDIVPGYAGTYIQITTDGTSGNSGSVVKNWYVGRITLAPARDTNAIGETHEIVAKVEYSKDGANWTVAPDGTQVTFSLSNNVPNAYFVGGVNSNTTVGGYTSIFINADNPGTVTIGASSNFTVSGINGTFSVSTGIGFSGSDVSKTYVKARITIEADDINAVGVSHTFTITLERDLGDGKGYVPFGNQTVTANLSGVGYFVGPSTKTTDSLGKATVTINSSSTGVANVSASFEGEIVAGNAATNVSISTDGTSDNSWPAVKTYVNARISIKYSADNVVGNQHTFIILLERDLGDGNGFVPFGNQTVKAALTGVGFFVGSNSQTTNTNGEATVTINSNDPGTSTVSASFAGLIVTGYAGTYIEISTDGTSGNSGPVDKNWYVGRITLAPARDTNAIGEPHEIVAKVEYSKDGTNWTVAPDGTLVTFSLSNNVPNAYFVGGVNTNTTTGGYTSIFINADSPGTVTIGGSSNFTVTGINGTFSVSTGTGFSGSDVTKTYIKARITIEADDTNAITVSHTFTITLERDLGDGNGYVPFSGQTVTASLTGVGYFVGINTPTTDANGQATVTINSNVPGVATVSAGFEGEIVAGIAGTYVNITTDGTSDNSGPAVKTYVNARITIKNPGDNVIGNQHTFTILLERDLGDGNGFVPFGNQTVNATLSGVGYFVGSSSQTTDANGQATVTINSNDPGVSTVSASFAGLVVTGYAGTYIEISTDSSGGNSGPVVKTWYVGRITLTPARDTNAIGEPHEMSPSACRTTWRTRTSWAASKPTRPWVGTPPHSSTPTVLEPLT
jgi:hypothetical protein